MGYLHNTYTGYLRKEVGDLGDRHKSEDREKTENWVLGSQRSGIALYTDEVTAFSNYYDL